MGESWDWAPQCCELRGGMQMAIAAEVGVVSYCGEVGRRRAAVAINRRKTVVGVSCGDHVGSVGWGFSTTLWTERRQWRRCSEKEYQMGQTGYGTGRSGMCDSRRVRS